MSDRRPRFQPLEDLRKRIKWLILLRWIAVGGLCAVISVSRYLFRVDLPVVYLYAGNAALLISNLAYALYLKRARSEGVNVFINVQISLDLLILAYLLHFSGGIGNPFFLFFIFHMVIASILLSNRAAYLQATFAVCLFAVLIVGQVLIPESENLRPELHPQYLIGLLAAFTAAIFITVYMTTSIVNTLRKREGELERAIGRLQKANSALETKDREKSRYVLTVTHDIKGSLSSIQSCLRVVLDELLGGLAAGPKDMINRAERRSLSLLRYVDELLYLSTLRAQLEIDKRELIPGEIIDRIVREFKSRASQKEVELNLSDETGGVTARFDPFALEELCRQLLDNAVKYTAKGGRIAVDLTPGAQQGGIELSVSDTGIGIAEEDLPHIYEDFYSADIPENREISSTGLGLAIVKQIVSTHSGFIDVESIPGQGSTFRCSMPGSENTGEGGLKDERKSKDLYYRG
jgi:signal transduction histidine kinase